jgi:hypothetical protein
MAIDEPKAAPVQDVLEKLKETDYGTYIFLTRGGEAFGNTRVPGPPLSAINPLRIYAISLEGLAASLKDALWFLDRCKETLKERLDHPETPPALARFEAQRQGIENLLATLQGLKETGLFEEE